MQISDFVLAKSGLYLDGEWVQTEKKIEVLNPFDYEPIGNAPFADKEHVTYAIDAAQAAFESFRFTPPAERAEMLALWASLIRENKDELIKMISLEQGKPLSEAASELSYGCSFLDWYVAEAHRIYGDIIESDKPDEKLLITRQPVGVVGAITPWNFPLAMITRKIAPALAVGCTVVCKPAEDTPFIAYALCQLAEDAGFPKGTINMITGDPAEIGEILCNDVRVRKVSFTGSTRVGKLLYRNCAEHVKKLTLELGGNAPFIVFESADIDAAIDGALFLKLRNSSQSCTCGNRFFIHTSVYDEFVKKFTERFSHMHVGQGMEDHDLGPLINKAAVSRVQELLASAVEEGATIAAGGSFVHGSCLEPTVITNVTHKMRIATEENFAPMVPIIRFSDEDPVVEWANSTNYGLAAYFYSDDYSQIMRVMDRLDYGMVGVNQAMMAKAQAPFGGIKESGMGKEGSMYGLDDYLERKYCCLKYNLKH